MKLIGARSSLKAQNIRNVSVKISIMKWFTKLLLLSTLFILTLTSINTQNFLKPNSFQSETRQLSKSIFSDQFIFIGDTGTGNNRQYEVADAIKNYCEIQKNCRAIFILGDVIYDEGVKNIDDPQFKTKFEDPYKELNLPFYITLGNHDNLGCVDCYINYSNKPEKWNMPGIYYKKVFDNVSLYAINTENFDSAQQEWLRNNIQKDKSDIKIVLGHRPLKTYEKEKINESWVGNNKLEDIVCNNADFYISGHSHLLEYVGVIEGCSVRQLVSGGGGAWAREVIKPYPGKFFFEGNGFLSLEIKGNKLRLVFINKKGETLYDLELEK